MGADRLDFITRDAYFTGVSAFNTVDIFRLTGNALLMDGQLVYRAKVVDNIYGLTLGVFSCTRMCITTKPAGLLSL